jgi:hypothetical protein
MNLRHQASRINSPARAQGNLIALRREFGPIIIWVASYGACVEKLKNSVAVVVTTIGRGEFLDEYHAAVLAENALDRVQFIVIPDRKSPPELAVRCAGLAKRGLRIHCPSLQEQETYLAKLNLSRFIPYDSDNRRNIGYLMALESADDFTISIDDDNFCRPGERFFAEHAVVAAPPVKAPSVPEQQWLVQYLLADARGTAKRLRSWLSLRQAPRPS